MNKKYIIPLLLIALGFTARLLPHPANFAPIGAIIVGYFVYTLISIVLKNKERLGKILFIVFLIIIILFFVYIFYENYRMSIYTAKMRVITNYENQWQKAMGWVRENTDKNAVFAHWWDYGYWVQTMGERATMLDGGNNIGYWNYLMGRHVLTAESEEEALELLYSHNVTHFLIDSTEIGKYTAYSSIGSDENYDKYSWIQTFILNEGETRESRESIIYVYTGGAGLDESFSYDLDEQTINFPIGETGIVAMVFELKKESDLMTNQPKAIDPLYPVLLFFKAFLRLPSNIV